MDAEKELPKIPRIDKTEKYVYRFAQVAGVEKYVCQRWGCMLH